MVTWNSIIFRLINIPMDKDNFDEELNWTIEKTILKGYKKDMILKFIININGQK